MKKQKKSSLLAAVVGASLSVVFFVSATNNNTSVAAMQGPLLQEQPISVPVLEPVAAEAPELPFTFYLALVTTFTNGGSIDFSLLGEEGESLFRNEMPNWGEEQ